MPFLGTSTRAVPPGSVRKELASCVVAGPALAMGPPFRVYTPTTKLTGGSLGGPQQKLGYLQVSGDIRTWSLWAGVDLRTVQQWLGHSDMESTMRYLKPSRSQQVRDKVNEIFA